MSNGHRHILQMPRVRKHGANGTAVHETGALVVCGGCDRSFILIEASDYARLLARAVAGSQKG